MSRYFGQKKLSTADSRHNFSWLLTMKRIKVKIVNSKTCLVAVVLIGSLFCVSWAVLARQGDGAASKKSAASESADAKIDWSLFLPAGDGQFQTAAYCSSCHTLQLVLTERRADEPGWTDTVQTMVFTHGAVIQDDDMAAIAKYLARFYGPSTPPLTLPIHINTAPKALLMLLASLNSDDVQKILDARMKEKLRDLAALEAVVGNQKATKYKSVLAFD
jgi:hypothetical protein